MKVPKQYMHTIERYDNINNYKNVILSCYFTLKRDPIHAHECDNGKQKEDNFNYIKPLYSTAKELDLHLVIFHDNLSKSFLDEYSTDKIIFLKTQLRGGLSINDERYIIYYEYLQKNKYEAVLTSDISDVYINSNPFDLLTLNNLDKFSSLQNTNIKNIGKEYQPSNKYSGFEKEYLINTIKELPNEYKKFNNKIFIGTNSMIRNTFTDDWFKRRKWKTDRFNLILKVLKFDDIGFVQKQKQMYNCGLIMARFDRFIEFIEKFLFVLFTLCLKNDGKNWNMVIANYIIVKYFFNNYNEKIFITDDIYTGFPFNSMYKKLEYDKNSLSCLIHK